MESEFILESERESFIEQVREVIENADEKGLERDTNKQVNTTLFHSLLLCFSTFCFLGDWRVAGFVFLIVAGFSFPLNIYCFNIVCVHILLSC